MLKAELLDQKDKGLRTTGYAQSSKNQVQSSFFLVRILRRDSTDAYLVGVPQSESDAKAASHSLQPMVDIAEAFSTKHEG